LLNEPVLRKVSLYLGIALIYVSPIRIWVFGLYFRNLRQALRSEQASIMAPATPDASGRGTSTSAPEARGVRGLHRHTGRPQVADTVIEAPEHDYLPTEIQRPNGTTVSSNAMLQELIANPRIWVRGAAGTGKSELVHEMIRLYSQQPLPHPYTPLVSSTLDGITPLSVP